MHRVPPPPVCGKGLLGSTPPIEMRTSAPVTGLPVVASLTVPVTTYLSSRNRSAMNTNSTGEQKTASTMAVLLNALDPQFVLVTTGLAIEGHWAAIHRRNYHSVSSRYWQPCLRQPPKVDLPKAPSLEDLAPVATRSGFPDVRVRHRGKH